ncbi:MAG: winged helix-turn-helix domain-containing protein [Woeseiaceae bacterium]|nr:winged helix-turn-helix domain-containing protein [Woeseiaceae bacterium]
MGTEYRFAGFSLRSRPLALYKGGEPIALSRRALELLRMLLEKDGELVAHAEVRERLWGSRTVEFSNSIYVYVNRIRTALGDNAGEQRFIESVPGYGYRFKGRVYRAGAGDDSGVVPSLLRRVALAALVSVCLNIGGTQVLQESLSYQGHTRAAFEKLESGAYAAAQQHASRALLLNPEAADAYVVQGDLALQHRWAWSAAKSNYERAIEIDPGSAMAYRGLAVYYVLRFDSDRALQHLNRALLLDPLSPEVANDTGWIYLSVGDYESAQDACREHLKIAPRELASRYCLIRAYAAGGNHGEVANHVAAFMNLTGAESGVIERVLNRGNASVYTAFECWRMSLIAQRSGSGNTSSTSLSSLALASANCGQIDQAIVAAERAARQREPLIPFVLADPRFVELQQSRSRVLSLVRQTGQLRPVDFGAGHAASRRYPSELATALRFAAHPSFHSLSVARL